MLRPDGTPVPYFGTHGIRWLMERLCARGWSATYEEGNPVALHRDGAWITLEPGSQFELSGAPFQHAEDVLAQARSFAAEVDAAIGDAPIRQVAVGFTPYARIEDIQWVPKARYEVMRAYLARTGDLAHHMMKGSASVQATFDFADEADCARKVRLGALLGPLTTAMFANSPLYAGKPTGFQSYRGYVWTRTDPSRTGFPPAILDFSFERWVDYLLDVPMMFTHIDGQWADGGGRTFRDWMQRGIDAVYPTQNDWDLHQTAVFPELRVKRQIELRGADCVSLPLASAFVTLFEGLLYCDVAQELAAGIAERFATHGTQEDRHAIACKKGLRGVVGGRSLASWAEQILEVSIKGLRHCGPVDRAHLAPLEAQVARGESPAEFVLRTWEADPDPETFLEAITLRS
ncbi:MAG: glutamate--cysteine ligase [Deltaproteobacteria bacterium]|nr:glutamate--cysteine ligase [Deltaproteobacteria bacterium]MBW2255144.1 glutamate--cysteine ligase [Deltaproteobacteria bacterium]